MTVTSLILVLVIVGVSYKYIPVALISLGLNPISLVLVSMLVGVLAGAVIIWLLMRNKRDS